MSKQYLTIFLGLGLFLLPSCTEKKEGSVAQEIATNEQAIGEQATPVEAVTQVAENDAAGSELGEASHSGKEV